MKHVWSRAAVEAVALVSLLAGVSGCDEIVEVTDLPPEVEPIGRCEEGGRTFLVLRLLDRESDPVDLAIAYEGGGDCAPAPGGLCALQTGGAGDGLYGLSTEAYPPGALHRIEWVDPVGVETLRITATDDVGERPAQSYAFPALDDCSP